MREILVVKNKIDEHSQRSFITGVSMITSYGTDGKNVMAAEWTMQVSYKPLLIAVFIHDGARTLQNIKKTKYFGLNVASESQSNLVSISGGYSGSEVDKLKIRDLFQLVGTGKNQIPLIRNCVINAECKLYAIKKIGDHNMVVGKVLSMTHDETKKPLLYHRNKYFKIGHVIENARDQVVVNEKVFDMFSRQRKNKFILKFVGVLVKSRGRLLVTGNKKRNSVYFIPCIQPRKGENYKMALENHLSKIDLKVSLIGDPMIKRMAIKHNQRLLRINFVLFEGILLDEVKRDYCKFAKPDSILKSLIKLQYSPMPLHHRAVTHASY